MQAAELHKTTLPIHQTRINKLYSPLVEKEEMYNLGTLNKSSLVIKDKILKVFLFYFKKFEKLKNSNFIKQKF